MRRSWLLPFAAIMVFAASQALSHDFTIGALRIDHPWARATPAGAAVGAGYFTIVNTGTDVDRLVAGTTDAAERLEIHVSETSDGIMRMRPATDGVEIPPGETVTLGPGGTHAMLVGLVRPLEQGDPVPATLVFEKAGSVMVELKVESLAYRPPAQGGDHDGRGAD